MHVLNQIAGSKELPKDTVEKAQVNLSKIAKQNTKPGMRPVFSATFDAYKTPYVDLPPKLAQNLAEYSKNARKAPMEEVTMKFSEFVSPEKYHKRTREPKDTLEKDSYLKPIQNYFKRTQESKERLEKDAHLKPRPPGPFPDMGKYKTKLSISIDSLRNLKLKNLDSDFSERFKKIDTKKYLKAKIDFIGEINAHLNEENKLFEIIDELDETINIRSDLPYKYIQNQINYIKAAIAAETMNFAQPKVKVKKLIGDTMKNLEDRVLILETLALSAYLIQMANIDANYLEHLGLVEYYLEQIKKMTSDEEYLHFRDLIIKKLKLVVDHGISPKLKTEDLFPVTKTGYKGTLFGLGKQNLIIRRQ
ncbi:expressed protein [Phakopsora pachyrhizi]|uniref:Expressed protein n=1 Tax=Phakopsora pachyrhizi TaxID=170000 RepID=A0AAV0AJG3_PHAPC|nr:expressed protein [Phakopsora pachyrhizi]